jgi:GNAT superfamily N-acetyltransferase
MDRPPTDAALVAEDADAYQPIPPSAIREMRPEVVLLHRPAGGAWSSLASRIRFGGANVDLQVRATRRWFRERGVEEFRWLVGPSATPEGVSSELIARGAIPDSTEPELAAMVLDREPPSVPGIRVQHIASLAEFERMESISRAAFGGPQASDVRARWHEFQATPGLAAFLAELDGAPVAFGVMSRIEHGPMLLAGGVTLPKARGRGAYRALIRARWEAARRTGIPVLVTQAQAASRPILEGLGFRATGTIQVLLDRRNFHTS